jgi:phosphate starvation-inducible PhoH-like protein
LQGDGSLLHLHDEVRIPFADASEALLLFGPHDAYLTLIEENSSAKIMTREGELVISGDKSEVDKLAELVGILLQLIRRGITLSERDISYAMMLSNQ